MVKLTGPMFSLTAAGKFGKAIVYSVWKGIAYARMLVIPANPNTDAQRSFRSIMTFLSQIWAGLTAGNKVTWVGPAEAGGYSTFNAFCSVNMSRWDLYDSPTKEFPAAEASASPAAPTTTPTAGVKQISLSIADGAPAPDWGYCIHRSLTTGFTPGRGTLCAVVERVASPTVYVDAPLDTGVPYYYRVQGFMDDGVIGTLEAEVTGTPT